EQQLRGRSRAAEARSLRRRRDGAHARRPAGDRGRGRLCRPHERSGGPCRGRACVRGVALVALTRRPVGLSPAQAWGMLARINELEQYLKATKFLESDSGPVRELAARATEGATGEIAKAVALYYAIRDGIRYDPYVMATDPEQYRASVVAELPAAYCIQKAILLAAAARAIGVPSRLGFAGVRNHLARPKLRENMGSGLFVFHRFPELLLRALWGK